jgi:hypothetical protein
MSGRNVAWTTAAATGIGCAVLAASAAWLLLTQPVTVTSALGGNDFASVINALITAVLDAAAAVMRMF